MMQMLGNIGNRKALILFGGLNVRTDARENNRMWDFEILYG